MPTPKSSDFATPRRSRRERATPIDLPTYVAGLQCVRRVWRIAHRGAGTGATGSDPDAAVRTAARALVEGAIEAGSPAATMAAVADPAVTAVLDPVWEADGLVGRAHALVRGGDGRFRIVVVRAISRVRDEQIDELAFLHASATAAGIAIGGAEIVHPDPEYVYDGCALDAKLWLARVDTSKDAAFLAQDVTEQCRVFAAARDAEVEPDIEPGPHCLRPRCDQWAQCSSEKPPDWVGRLPGLRPAEAHALREAGVGRTGEIRADFVLRPPTRRAAKALAAGRVEVAPALAAALANLAGPVDALDFEALVGPIPYFAGTRPFQPVPFQWAAELADATGHRAVGFLAEAGRDPRRAVAESLLEALGGRACPVLVYSGFEAEVIADLAGAFADLADGLRALAGRLRDLLPVVRAGVYHPDFGGSFSLKAVAPALAPPFTWADLSRVADGGAATRAFERMLAGGVEAGEVQQLRADLRVYCARDARALVDLLAALRALVA